MRGVVFLMFEAFVVERRGHDAYEALLAATAGRLAAAEPYLGALSYRDEDLLALLDAEAEASGLARPALLRELGEFCVPRLAQRFAWAFAGHGALVPFLSHLRRVTHGRVDFGIAREPDGIALSYAAPAGLCPLAEGMLHGLARHFRTPFALAERACVERGDAQCEWKAVVA